LYCSNCGALNKNEANFCVNCGHPLTQPDAPAQKEDALTQHDSVEKGNEFAQPSPSHDQHNAPKKMFLNYWEYFKTALKRPVPVSEKMTKNESLYGFVTILIFAFLIPLMIYFALRRELGSFMYYEIGFADIVIKPVFFILLMIFLVISIMFGVLNIGNSSADFKEIVARFGTLLVTPSLLLGIAFIFSLLDSEILVVFLYLGLIGFSFVIPLTIYGYKKNESSGLDAFYATFLTYIGFVLALFLLGKTFIPVYFDLF